MSGSDDTSKLVAFAIGAHPDDIEFMMAGTLLLLKAAGAEIHMWNLANGNCGTAEYTSDEITLLRAQEARDSAAVAGASVYPPLVDDLDLFYDAPTLAKVAARVRDIKPNIILLPSPQDYMEDHQNACRLGVSAAFVRGMRNFPTDPPLPVWEGDTVLYHALPYGLRDALRGLIVSGQYVDVSSVLKTKCEMLSQHRTQKEWLDASQGIDAYLTAMEEMCGQVGAMSGCFDYAEGWRRHSHLGFGPEGWDPMSEALGDRCWVDPDYEKSLG